MNTRLNHRTLTVLTVCILLTATAFTYKTSGDWDVPEKYVKMENPMEADDESLDFGEELWELHCRSCHGKYGEGDGSKADGLEAFPGDFTSSEFQDQTDGEIFYKSKYGKDEMPDFTKKIPYDEDIWHLVNYMRTM